MFFSRASLLDTHTDLWERECNVRKEEHVRDTYYWKIAMPHLRPNRHE